MWRYDIKRFYIFTRLYSAKAGFVSSEVVSSGSRLWGEKVLFLHLAKWVVYNYLPSESNEPFVQINQSHLTDTEKSLRILDKQSDQSTCTSISRSFISPSAPVNEWLVWSWYEEKLWCQGLRVSGSAVSY